MSTMQCWLIIVIAIFVGATAVIMLPLVTPAPFFLGWLVGMLIDRATYNLTVS